MGLIDILRKVGVAVAVRPLLVGGSAVRFP